MRKHEQYIILIIDTEKNLFFPETRNIKAFNDTFIVSVAQSRNIVVS